MHPDLAAFAVVIEIDVAWAEMDAFAHVNNVVYFRYFEHARIAYLTKCGWFKSMDETGRGPIVSATNARFRKPVRYPDRLHLGARVIDLQPDRVTFEHKVFSTTWNAVACEGTAVVVSFDYRAATKCPIPETVRTAILEMEKAGG